MMCQPCAKKGTVSAKALDVFEALSGDRSRRRIKREGRDRTAGPPKPSEEFRFCFQWDEEPLEG